jgi:spore germination protein GerM
MLVPVIRRAAGAPSITMTLRELTAGPTADDRARGLDSALTGAPIVGSVHIDNGRAVAELTDVLQGTGRNDQILALGQIVCTLDARADVAGVVFVRDGVPAGVPRADGSLSTEPLTTADYATLMTDA